MPSKKHIYGWMQEIKDSSNPKHDIRMWQDTNPEGLTIYKILNNTTGRQFASADLEAVKRFCKTGK